MAKLATSQQAELSSQQKRMRYFVRTMAPLNCRWPLYEVRVHGHQQTMVGLANKINAPAGCCLRLYKPMKQHANRPFAALCMELDGHKTRDSESGNKMPAEF